ncbi:MAG: TlpA family protein disulfide reductase [Akkermansiaceae bacterium]
MKNIILKATLGLALYSSLLAGPADDIAKKHAKATAAEVEAYLKENPDASDKARAQQLLLISYNVTGETEKSVAIFQEKFNALGSGADVNTMALYSTTNSLYSLLVKVKKPEAASAALDQAIKKAAGNAQEEQLISGFQLLKAKLTKPKVGDTVEMKFTSLQGEEVDLTAMKGKVVLIDFWATWCGPCIAELPHLQKAYAKYHDKGFEIIGVSLDKQADQAKLESFIKNKEMTWPQHFDGKGGVNEFAVKFGVTSIPSTYLIGKDGKIVATNLRGDALDKALEQNITK